MEIERLFSFNDVWHRCHTTAAILGERPGIFGPLPGTEPAMPNTALHFVSVRMTVRIYSVVSGLIFQILIVMRSLLL